MVISKRLAVERGRKDKMAEIIKTIDGIEDIFREVVLMILKLDPNENHERVRFPWGSNLSSETNSSAPSWNKGEDICFIYVLPQDDFYNRQRNRRYVDRGGRDLVEIEEYTDVHHVNFVNYGPSAYECARAIRDGLFAHEVRRFLRKNDFSLVTDVPAIRRLPELVQGEWHNRADISASFNEFVRRESEMPIIEEISLHVQNTNKNGEASREENIERRGSECPN